MPIRKLSTPEPGEPAQESSADAAVSTAKLSTPRLNLYVMARALRRDRIIVGAELARARTEELRDAIWQDVQIIDALLLAIEDEDDRLTRPNDRNLSMKLDRRGR